MPNTKQTKSEALATIDAAIAILDKFPDLDQVDMSLLSANTSTNPFQFLMDAFKSCAGYNVLIKILSTFISTQLPIVEMAVKGVLLTNIKNLLSCSINPFITDEMLENGITFDLNEIDITDTLQYSPTSKIGKYYYFGCDDCLTIDDVRQTAYEAKTPDMNALLWYIKNRGVRREVWGRKLEGNTGEGNVPQEKKSGVITLEYCEDSRSVKNCYGSSMSLQTPINNVLHVFIGNVREMSPNKTIDDAETALSTINSDMYCILEIREKVVDAIDECNEKLKKAEKKYLNGKMPESEYEVYYNTLQTHITDLKYLLNSPNGSYYETNAAQDPQKEKHEASSYTVDEIYSAIMTQLQFNDPKSAVWNTEKDGTKKLKKLDYDSGIDTILKAAAERRKSYQSQIYGATSGTEAYRQDIKLNYYYRKTLIQFNFDYIMSLKLFDAKVITAQLLDSITGMLSIDLNLSYKIKMIREQITKMVKMIVETDDTVVSDCFFTFSNDEYNSMLEKTELQKAKLFTANGEQNTTAQIDADQILQSLNGISADASEETIQTTIEGALTDISGTINTYNYENKDQLNFGAQINFIENLMNNLACVIAQAVLSPKVYLLILINLRTLGQDTNFKLEDFIKKFQQLIVSLLRELRDQLIQYLVTELMKLLGSLAAEIAVKIGVEQAQYYARLIKKIIACFKSSGQTLDFSIDDVSADIYETEDTPKNNEC